MGDLTNLVGAFLTRQLPIQIVIAAYMLVIDVSLCIQYGLYYQRPEKIQRVSGFSAERSPLISGPSRHARAMSRVHYKSRGHSLDPWLVYRVKPHRTAKRSYGYGSTHLQPENLPINTNSRKAATSLDRGRNRATRHIRGYMSRSNTLQAPSRVGLDAGSLDISGKMRREHGRSTNGLRRGSVMAMLSVGMLVSLGPMNMHMRQNAPPLVSSTSLMAAPTVVAAQKGIPPPWDLFSGAVNISSSPISAAPTTATTAVPLPAPRYPILLYMPDMMLFRRRRRQPHEPPLPLSVVIGRISAWLCTLLYMTSRLPQIWSNFRRKSVRGLSMLLFLLAFIANLLYSISIVSNPKAVGPGSYDYLLESLPFLLGSSGTLIFDVVILAQYAMWYERPVPKARSTIPA